MLKVPFPLLFGFFLITVPVWAETPDPPPPTKDVPLPESSWYTALTQVKSVPQNIWERLKLADQWVWDEYPDQVLIHSDERIKWPRYLGAAFNLPSWLDVGFTNRIRREGFDFPYAADQEGTTWDWGQRTRFRATARWKQFRTEFELQGANSGEDADTDVVGTSTFNAANVQQFFLSVTLPNIWDTGFRTDLHVGRINLDIGSRRLIARSRFSNTSQAFDGIHWRLADPQKWFFRTFFTQIVFNDDNTDRLALFTNSSNLLWGFFYENHAWRWSKFEFYYYGVKGEESGGREERNHSSIGFRIFQRPDAGGYDYQFENIIQFGEIDDQDHLAHFHHASFGYTFVFPWSPRIMAMYDYASGTNNPKSSNTSHTFDGLFGARRFELSATGLFGPFFRSNISSPGIRLIVHPRKNLKLNLKYRAWWLAQSRDAWVNSGMQDLSGGSGAFLGQDIEVRVQWHPSPNFTVDAGYEHFIKGSFIKDQTDIPGNPPSNSTNYFYIQTEVMF